MAFGIPRGVSLGIDYGEFKQWSKERAAKARKKEELRQRLGRLASEYTGQSPTQQERTLQQTESLLRTSGIAEAKRRYAELEQTLQQMPYDQRLNRPEIVRTIQQEMEQLQKKIQSGYSLAEKYLQTQINTERQMDERQRMMGPGVGSFPAQVATPDLQSKAARGFYQTPYAYQNA